MPVSAKDNLLLDGNFNTARRRLHKMLLFKLAQSLQVNTCFRCEQEIESEDELSVDHKSAWRSSEDPKAAFFDLENIAFSHLSCNSGENNRSKEACPQGHPYDYKDSRGNRKCKRCNSTSSKKYRASKVHVDE